MLAIDRATRWRRAELIQSIYYGEWHSYSHEQSEGQVFWTHKNWEFAELPDWEYIYLRDSPYNSY